MQFLIVEDEFHAAKRLQSMLSQLIPDGELLQVVDSVEDAVDWFSKNPQPDLVFMDIQLADGISFDIFRQTNIEAPVIFTTAFDEYALKAFKTNSVDYLLKPIDQKELEGALEKYRQLFGKKQTTIESHTVESLLRALAKPEFAKRFLIKSGQSLSYLEVSEIAYVFSEEGMTYLVSHQNKKYHIEYTMEQLEELLDPDKFYRINRKILVSIPAIQKVSDYFNSRLIIDLRPNSSLEAIVSRERVKDFKQWLGA